MLIALLAATLVWDVCGTVTRSVAGNAILVARGGQLIDAQSSGPGQIVSLAVRPGDRVEAMVEAKANPGSFVNARPAIRGWKF